MPSAFGVNCGEHVAITSDFLLGSVPRLGLVGREFRDTTSISRHAFDAVGRLDALDACRLAKRQQKLRRLPLEELLLALVFAEESDRAHGRHRYRHLLETSTCERAAHRSPSEK